jgi:hypothetical protein
VARHDQPSKLKIYFQENMTKVWPVTGFFGQTFTGDQPLFRALLFSIK